MDEKQQLPDMETKLADAVTNLEIAIHYIRGIIKKEEIKGDAKSIADYSVQLMRETLEILRGLEVKEEIEKYSRMED